MICLSSTDARNFKKCFTIILLNTLPKEKEENEKGALQEEEGDELRLGTDYAKVGVNEVDAKSPPQLTKAKVGPLGPETNSDFPAMSEGLEVVFEPGKGRHVVAKRDIQGWSQGLVDLFISLIHGMSSFPYLLGIKKSEIDIVCLTETDTNAAMMFSKYFISTVFINLS